MSAKNLDSRLAKLEAGRHGKKIVTFDDWGDAVALANHDAIVRQMEADGYEVINIIRVHTHEGLAPMAGVMIERSYGVQP